MVLRKKKINVYAKTEKKNLNISLRQSRRAKSAHFTAVYFLNFRDALKNDTSSWPYNIVYYAIYIDNTRARNVCSTQSYIYKSQCIIIRK